MAIYRIFPEKDAEITSLYLNGNTGKDEIVSINGYIDGTGTRQISRLLVKYSTQEINEIIDNLVNGQPYTATLDYYLAEAHQVPTSFKIESFPLFTSGGVEWDNGTGKKEDIPINTTGVSWSYINANSTNPWTNSIQGNITGSYLSDSPGGGAWYSTYNSTPTDNEQIFNLNDPLDIEIDVTSNINLIYSNSIDNRGFILKLEEELELNPDYNTKLSYFSADTNTIYPPTLSIKWNDSIYQTGSLETLNTDIASVDITNNKGTYVDEGKQRFKITARPTYPERKFVTSSIYLDNYALPEQSYWGIKDENTEEMIIDFDENYTKISCNESGSFFDVYLDSFQPERFYRILIKTELDGSTIVINKQNVFKVVRNG